MIKRDMYSKDNSLFFVFNTGSWSKVLCMVMFKRKCITSFSLFYILSFTNTFHCSLGPPGIQNLDQLLLQRLLLHETKKTRLSEPELNERYHWREQLEMHKQSITVFPSSSFIINDSQTNYYYRQFNTGWRQ